ncbi:hypothetical protein Pdw03_2225 [Penicillium digitatum]|uniref:Uncharacterized protein n=1 Tax=Penicillium digitatum TaxID=36651 RepID=A0A7T6XUJ0_PENDI|nr:hypothetical protein Pdw03_2225 [Penicillium digitatum]
MRLRSNHVLPPISEYVPRRRRTTRSASAAATETAPETAPDVAQETVSETQSAAEKPAPKRKPAKRGGRKKKPAAKGKNAAAPTGEPEDAEAQAESQEDPVALIPSVEQPDTQPSRKRNRLSEDEPSPSKRHKLALRTPTGFENRPRGSSRRTYADRARRREAERDGRIDRTIYRFPQLLAQQGEDARSGSSTLSASNANEETAPHDNRIVPLSSLPSELPPSQTQNRNRPGWRQWIFNSVTGLWGRGNVLPHTAEVPQVAEPQHPMGNEYSSVTTPSSAPPPKSSLMLSRSFESPTPRPRVAVPNSRLTASARAPRVDRNRYSYDLFPRGFDPELLARMRAGKSDPADIEPVTSEEQVRAIYEKESKKRKRSPSPDVIPHPPGCSYGFDPDYFIYDEDDEDLLTGEQELEDTTIKQATVCDVLNEEHVSKSVRQDTTAKQVTVSDVPEEGHVSKRVRQETTTKRAAPSDEPEEEHVSKSVQSEDIHLESFNDQGASQPIEYSSDELRKARKQAEQYKPKTPSRLRAAHRFSGSCNSFIDEDVLRRRKMRKTSLATACPTGDLSQIIWPETESWVECFGWHDPNLDKYRKRAYPICHKFPTPESFIDHQHGVFMSRLATRRAAQ